ncbi:hypothetical protein ACJJTC_005145 [Scirpophaga incertulas]
MPVCRCSELDAAAVQCAGMRSLAPLIPWTSAKWPAAMILTNKYLALYSHNDDLIKARTRDRVAHARVGGVKVARSMQYAEDVMLCNETGKPAKGTAPNDHLSTTTDTNRCGRAYQAHTATCVIATWHIACTATQTNS